MRPISAQAAPGKATARITQRENRTATRPPRRGGHDYRGPRAMGVCWGVPHKREKPRSADRAAD